MKSLFALLLLNASTAFAGTGRPIPADSTSQTTYIRIVDATDGSPETGVVAATSGLDLEYVRLGASAVDITESDLAAADSAYSSGGIKHVGGGVYRLDVPDAAIANGVDQVSVQGTVTGMVVLGVTHPLTTGVEYLPKGGRLWFVATTGSDSNTGVRQNKFLTVQHAVDVAAPGDVIDIAPGSYSEQVTITTRDLTLQGHGPAGCTITHAAASTTDWTLKPGANTKLYDLQIVTTSNGWAMTPNGESQLTCERCVFNGLFDSVFFDEPPATYGFVGIIFRDCRFQATYDGVILNSVNGFLFERCYFRVTGEFLQAGGVDLPDTHAVKVAGSVGSFRDCTFEVAIPATGTDLAAAHQTSGCYVQGKSQVTFDNCKFPIKSLITSGYTGSMYGIRNHAPSGEAAAVTAKGCYFEVTEAGTGATRKHVSVTGSPSGICRLQNCFVDKTLCTNNVKFNDDIETIEGADATTQIAANTTGSGPSTTPVNQVPVPPSRTWKAKATEDGGLVGELPLSCKVSALAKVFQIDFSGDLATNGRVVDINSVAIVAGDGNGLLFGADIEDQDDYGVDRAASKWKITPLTAGEYTLRVSVDYDPSDGGGGNECDVILNVSN